MTNSPQLRRDPIVDRWVLIAPERAARPHADEAALQLADDTADCPLCEGRERQTPLELFAVRSTDSTANQPGWQVRVVPNRFPAVRMDAETGRGSHELVIDCPQHFASLSALPVTQIAAMLGAVRERFKALRDSGSFAYAQYFKNHGAAAGASLTHAHGQIIALPGMPPAVAAEMSACRDEQCAFCKLVEREIVDGSRVVRMSENFVTLTAYAGRFPYETWLLPRKHSRHFEDLGDSTELATEVHWLIERLEAVAKQPAFNLLLHNGPWTADGGFHWHFELLPRMTGVAGFEWSSGVFINPMPPEEAARKLRSS